MTAFSTVAGLGLAASCWLDRANRRTRLLWFVALLGFAGNVLITTVFELPANDAFAAHAVPPDQVGPALDAWVGWHVTRVAFELCAAVFAAAAVAHGRAAGEQHRVRDERPARGSSGLLQL